MVVVTNGLTPEGQPCSFYLDGYLQKNLDEIRKVVGTGKAKGKDWDYVAIVSGNPGAGKSNFAQSCARYCCEWFDEKYIAFSAEEFIEITNSCPENSSVILDESFQSMNAKSSMSSDFVRIINHLQLIRQKNLYIFLCLPNFFDLAKGVAIYRSHHLFVVYSPAFGERGHFAAYSREEKKNLYILGSKFMNYNAVKPNFRGRFTKSQCVNEDSYLARKKEHLMSQNPKERVHKGTFGRDKLIIHLVNTEGWDPKKVAEIVGLTKRQVDTIRNKRYYSEAQV